jgi:hypothetical protein
MTAQPPWLALRQLIESDVSADRLQAVVMYVNRMLEAQWQPDELPRAAVVSYYVDCYADLVLTGGVDRFVTHCRWDSFVIACVRDGLATFSSREHINLFQRITDTVETWRPEVRRAIERGHLTDQACIAQLQAHRAAFTALENAGPSLLDLNARHLAGLPGLERLDPANYDLRMAALTTLDAARRERRTSTSALAWAAQTPQERAIRAWAQNAGRPISCVMARAPIMWLDRPTVALHFQAAGIAYRAVDIDANRVLIVDEGGRQEASLALAPFLSAQPPRPRPGNQTVPATPPVRPVVRSAESNKVGTNWTLIIWVVIGLIVLRMLVHAARQ